MNPKMDETALRKKNRSLETLLSRSRVYAAQLEVLTESAVTAMEKMKNAEIKEGCGIIRAAVGEARRIREAGNGDAVSESSG